MCATFCSVKKKRNFKKHIDTMYNLLGKVNCNTIVEKIGNGWDLLSPQKRTSKSRNVTMIKFLRKGTWRVAPMFKHNSFQEEIHPMHCNVSSASGHKPDVESHFERVQCSICNKDFGNRGNLDKHIEQSTSTANVINCLHSMRHILKDSNRPFTLNRNRSNAITVANLSYKVKYSL